MSGDTSDDGGEPESIEVYSWPTPNGHQVHIMLEECGLSCRVPAVDIGAANESKRRDGVMTRRLEKSRDIAGVDDKAREALFGATQYRPG